MGVPAFFRWLCKKYPSIVVQCAEEKSRTDPNTEEKIPLDLTQPNPNGIEFDNLYLDMNGIIHPCTHPEDRPAPKNENEMMVIIFEFIDRLFAIVRPRKLLYMAIDGVAPRAKMNQQRSRRFRAAKDSYEKSAEIRRIKEQILANGGVVPPDVPQSEKFDSNCITPGTPFMHRLAECLRYYVYERVNSDPAWSKLTVILSDANVPGEGEHKIMDFIRRQRANPDHDPNTHHVLCGADADLIMLGLATHEPHFTIIREEFRADRPRPCEVCNQFGHDSKECQGLARVKAGQHDELASTFVPSEQRYIFLRLNILREYLNKELFVHNLPFTFDIERAIDDWVFMCFFVGNDFLPHLPSLEIREGAIDRLVTLYKNMISRAGGYLTDCGDVHLERVQIILAGIGDVEDDIFKRRQRNELEFRQRNKDRRRNAKERSRVGDDMPLKMPEWMKSGPFAPTPLGKKPSLTPLTTPNKFEALEKSEPGLATTESAEDLNEAESDESKRGHKRKLTGEPESPSVSAYAAAAAAANKTDPDGSAKKKVTEEDTDISNRSEVVVLEEEDEDEDANDHVRLWEDGWKQRYYKIKFNVEEEDFEFRRKIAHHYTIGLQWVLKYYYQGVPSWNWYFPYHYAPFASDFVDIAEAVPGFNEPTEPFKPFEQLMAVFPAASKQHIPKPWQQLMTDENSVIIDFYPEDFQVDLNGKKQSWQGVALLPFVDEARLKKALLAYADRLSPEEKKRNTRGYDRIFVGKQHPLYEKFKQAYAESNGKELRDLIHSHDLDPNLVSGIAGKFWFDEYAVMEGETYPSPIQHVCPAITNNHVLSMQFHDPVYDNEYIFKANILEGAVFPDATLKPGDYEPRNWRPNTGFRQNNDYRNNRNPNAANRMVQNSLGGQPIDTRDNRVMSSAYGGQGSNLYGAYRSSPNFNNNNQQQQQQQQQGNNNYYYNYNSSNSQQQQQQNRYQNNNNNYSNYGNNLNQQNNRNQGYNNNYNNNNNNYQQQRYQSTNNNNQYNNNRNNNYNSNNRGANNQGNNQGQQQQQQRFNRNNNNNYNNNNSGKPYN